MAGVAPQHRGGGSSTTKIPMIVSIIVNVALIATLILLFTGLEELKARADRVEKAAKSLASSGDEQAARDRFADTRGSSKTLVGEMMQWFRTTAGRMTGSQDDSPQMALQKLDAALQGIRDAGEVPNPDLLSASNGVVAILQGLHKLYTDEASARRQLAAGLKKAEADLDASQVALRERDEKFKSDLAKISDRLTMIEKSKSELDERMKADIEAISGKLAAKQNELSTERSLQAKLRGQWAREQAGLESLISDQRVALGVMKGAPPPGAQPLAVARKPIGKVLRALPGDALVHIGLGRSDGVTLGMSFAVYSSDVRVPDNGRGKAHIEVVSVDNMTSECKVVTPPSPDNPILVGDGVGNIVLGRSMGRKTRFCVVGDFDVNGDGFNDPRGFDVIRALVTRAGGEVVRTVDASTDYLIVGSKPQPEDIEAMAPASETATDDWGTEDDAVGDDASETEDDDWGEDDWGEDDSGGEEDDEWVEEDDDTGDDGAVASDDDDDDWEEDDETGDDEAGDNGFDTGDEDEQSDEVGDDDMDADEPPVAVAPTPALAVARRPFGIDPTKPAVKRRKLREDELYELAVRRAAALSIPRLTFDHFLNFVGIERGAKMIEQVAMDM